MLYVRPTISIFEIVEKIGRLLDFWNATLIRSSKQCVVASCALEISLVYRLEHIVEGTISGMFGFNKILGLLKGFQEFLVGMWAFIIRVHTLLFQYLTKCFKDIL